MKFLYLSFARQLSKIYYFILLTRIFHSWKNITLKICKRQEIYIYDLYIWFLSFLPSFFPFPSDNIDNRPCLGKMKVSVIKLMAYL